MASIQPEQNKKQSWLFVPIVIIALLCAASFIFVAWDAVSDKRAAWWAQLLLGVTGVMGACAYLLLSNDRPDNARNLRSWLAPKPAALLFTAAMSTVTAISPLLNLFAPRPAVESEEGKIEATTSKTAETVEEMAKKMGIGEAPPVVQHIQGLWGEEGCGVIYKIELKGNALVVDAVRRPPGAEPWKYVATVTVAEGMLLETVGDEPAEEKGRSNSFTYVPGGKDRLTWDNKRNGVPLKLDDCSEAR